MAIEITHQVLLLRRTSAASSLIFFYGPVCRTVHTADRAKEYACSVFPEKRRDHSRKSISPAPVFSLLEAVR